MFAGIRNSFALLVAGFANAFKGTPIPELAQAPAPVPKVAPFQAPSRVYRSRMPHSNREARRKAGLPHGTSGAKLIRRAATARLTLRGQDVALYAA